MKKFLLVFLILLIQTIPFSNVTIKLGSLTPLDSPWDRDLRTFAEELSEITSGKFKIRIYSGGIAGDEMDMIRKMRLGQLDAAGLSGVGLSKIVGEIMALQMPRKIQSNEELFYVIENMQGYFEEKFLKEGFVIVIWSHIGWVHFFSKRAVVAPEDLRRMRMWVWEGDAKAVQAWKEQGFNPIPLSATEIMTSLQSGMTEALATSPLNAASHQWFGLANNMCGMRWAPFIGGVIFTKRAWERIPKENRELFLERAREISKRTQKDVYRLEEQAIDTMLSYGLKIHPVSDEVVKQWEEQIEVGFGKLIGANFEKKAVELVEKYLDEYRNKKQE